MRSVALLLVLLVLPFPHAAAAPQTFNMDVTCEEGTGPARVSLCRFTGLLQFSALSCDAAMCHVGIVMRAFMDDSAAPEITGMFLATAGFFQHDEVICDVRDVDQDVSCQTSRTFAIERPATTNGCTHLTLTVGATIADPAGLRRTGGVTAIHETSVCLVGGIPSFKATESQATYFSPVPV